MLLKEIAQYIHINSLGEFDETGVSGDIFIATLPSSPDDCVSIYPSGGLTSDGKLGYDNPTVQIIVRGTLNPMPAYERAQSIYNLLHGFHHGFFMPSGTYIVNCRGLQSGPNHIGQDENRRHEYSINFQLEVRNNNRE